MDHNLLPKHYDSERFEQDVLQMWLKSGAYARTERRAEHNSDYTIVMPPPNVTGILHMGHAMGDTLQDVLIRYHRMKGDSTRWIFGCDHAGISTQTKVDKKLKAEGISRLEIGRDAFIDACWGWTREYGGTIALQIKRMGCSCDFSDEQFTMSEQYKYAVRKVFCDWYHDGLIYRGKRIVNWCPSCRTAISDDECEYKDEFGKLWSIRYPLKEPVDGIDYIVVATTRPETMLGDTGVAVSPDDPEKKRFVGKTVVLPLTGREIPIFEDWHVDPKYGTGFVKVTPAHDPHDYAMGEAHQLDFINIIDDTAHVVEGYGELSGLSREDARDRILERLKDLGLLEEVSDIEHAVMHCYRCDTTLEPWLSEQWFVAVDRLKEPAVACAEDAELTFNAKRWEQSYLSWLAGVKDWCISRQLWWGHRIPVFSCNACGWSDALMEDPAVCPQCGSHDISQDPDVLDTWFSSQLWPFATQGWPKDTAELAPHYPTAALVTARDIIALWVARMVMSSEYFLGEVPFHDVVIYPTVLAKDGSRMSKSKGNGVDPMDLIERYGADAMRYALTSLVTGNQDVRFDAEFGKDGQLKRSAKTEAAQAFVTKIWNAVRFCLLQLDGYEPGEPSTKTPEDRWILSLLANVVKTTTQQLETYQFSDYAKTIMSFFWNEVCDWYIELIKGRMQSQDMHVKQTAMRNLVFVIDTMLKIMHPVMPFVTEMLWQQLLKDACDDAAPHNKKRMLMEAPWPDIKRYEHYSNKAAEQAFDRAKRLISRIRALRLQLKLSPKEPLDLVVLAEEEPLASLKEQEAFITRMAQLATLRFVPSQEASEKPHGSVGIIEPDFTAYLVVGERVDFEAEKARLTKSLAKAEGELAGIQKTLQNEGFLAQAAPDVVQAKRDRAEELTQLVQGIQQQIDAFA